MYRMLIVDDEEIAVRGIKEGIDWSDMPLEHIYTAYDVTEAKEIMKETKIHVLLSDIDMPDDNGIELLKWANAHSLDTETIFLTGHADFSYAQQAVHLNSFDYLLKPVDHGALKETVKNALDKIRRKEELLKFNETYEFYYRQWNTQLPILAERFWQDILNLRIPMSHSHLESSYALYSIPLQPHDPVQLVLISVEEWSEPLNTRDEEIMTYAVKNAAEEMILDGSDGKVIQDDGLLYAIVYNPAGEVTQRLQHNCRRFIESSKQYFHCTISCYIDEAVAVPELHTAANRLIEMERDRLYSSGEVILRRDYQKSAASMNYHPNFTDWAVLLENNKQGELHVRIAEAFAQMEAGQADLMYLEGFYHGLSYIVFQTFLRKSASMEEVYSGNEWRDTSLACKSMARLKEWAYAFVDRAFDYMREHNKEVSSVVQKAIHYIEEHIADELSREDIAAHVYLNPAYLSRLFKKETGQSLTDYILDLRIARVKPQLESTNLKISDIAMSVGYDNFSHFTKMFKKATGLTPYEYRRKYQQV